MPITKKATLAIATLLTFLGLFTLSCWHMGALNLLDVYQDGWPVPYQAALNTLLAGLALFSMIHKKGSFITKILGCFLLGNTFLAAYYMLFSSDFGFSSFLIALFHLPPTKFTHMVEMGIFSYLLFGIFCLIWHTNKRSSVFSHFSSLFSLLIFFLGFFFVLTQFLPLKIPSTFKENFPIHSYSSLSIFLTGIGLICLNFYWDTQFQSGLTKVKSFTLTIGFIFFSILISLGLVEEKNLFVTTLLTSQSNAAKKLTLERLDQSLKLLKGSASILQNEKETANEDWQLDTKNWMNANPSIINFFWLDDHFKEIFKATDASSALPIEVITQIEPSALKNEPYVAIVPEGKNYTLIMCYPLYWDNMFQGELIEVFDTQKYFERLFSANTNFTILVKSNNQTLAHINAETIKHSSLKIEVPIFFNNLNLHLIISPSEAFIKLHNNNIYIYIVLFGGFVIASSLGALLYLWQKNKLQLSNLQILETEHSFVLSAANIGRWSFDIEKKIFKFDPYSLYLYGKEKEDPFLSLDEFLNTMIEEDRDKIRNILKKSILSSSLIDTTFKIHWPNDSIHSILFKGTLVYDKERPTNHFSGINWDITQLTQSKQLLGASEAIAKLFTESESLTDSLKKILQILHQFLEWDVLTLWYKDKKSLKIQYLESATIEGLTTSTFIDSSKKLGPLAYQNTFPDSVLITFLPVQIKDITKEPGFRRKKAAIKENFHGALAFPIIEVESLTGVVELFRRKPLTDEITEQMTNFIMTLAIELGQFIQRNATRNELKKLAHTIQSSSVGIFHIDLNGAIQSWNPGAEAIYGWTYKDMVDQLITKTYPKESLFEFDRLLHKLKTGNNIEHLQLEMIRKDGKKIWVENTISPMYGPNKEITGYSVISLDITEQKTLADNFLKTEKKFHDFVETVEEWIWEVDTKMNFTYSNPYISKILGFSLDEVIGKNILLFIFEEDQEKFSQECETHIQNKKGWASRILTLRHKNGSLRYLESNAEPVLDENNQLLGFRGADRDITERINIEKSNNEFISMVSHELRTPLTSIYGSLGLLLEENLSKENIELLEMAERNCKRLIAIINDVLDSEKIQLGKFKLSSRIISITKVLKEAIQTASLMAQKFQVTLKQEGSFPEIKIYADPDRLAQVILNILSNAIKVSPPKETVQIFLTKELDHVKVSIQDKGPGIPKSFQPHIFEKFAQVGTGDTRSATGTGLGLNISKGIIEQLNGTIGFISEEKVGSTFFFTLPLKES